MHALGSAQRSIFASDNVSALNKNQGTGGTVAVCLILMPELLNCTGECEENVKMFAHIL